MKLARQSRTLRLLENSAKAAWAVTEVSRPGDGRVSHGCEPSNPGSIELETITKETKVPLNMLFNVLLDN